MNHPRYKYPSAFKLASKPVAFAVEVSVDDVLAIRPDWSREVAEAFIEKHMTTIAAAMTNASVTAMIAAMGLEGGHVH